MRASKRVVLIANSEGLLTGDEQARTRFTVSCVATGDTGLQTGFESAARTSGSSCSTRSRWRSWPSWPPTGPCPSCGPAGSFR